MDVTLPKIANGGLILCTMAAVKHISLGLQNWQYSPQLAQCTSDILCKGCARLHATAHIGMEVCKASLTGAYDI